MKRNLVSSTELMSRVIVIKRMSANRVLAQGLLLKPIYKVEFYTVLMSAHLGSVNQLKMDGMIETISL